MSVSARTLVLTVGLALACQSPPQLPPQTAPGLLSTSSLRTDALTLRQRIRYHYGERTGSLDAVVEKSCDALTVVGLGPFGTRLFSVQQSGTALEMKPELPEAWPFPPDRILVDTQRTYLYPLANPPPADGRHDVRYSDVWTSEIWQRGLLLERTIPVALESDGTGKTSGYVTIRYGSGLGRDTLPSTVTITDSARGYTLEVETIDSKTSTCPAENRESR